MKRARAAAAPKLQRSASLGGVPHRLPVVRRCEREGKLHLTVRFERPRWQRLLGGAEHAERTFALDAYGRRVYDGCDGRSTVRDIVHRFARQTQVSPPEAELAVARFLRTLMNKGLVVMELEKAPA